MAHQLKKNVFALTLLQVGNYLVPIAILPYLTRVLGVNGFGRIGFAAAFTMYFVLIVEWGFNLSSTRDVSVLRADKVARSAVFWETVAARLLLLLGSSMVLLALIGWVSKLGEQSMLLWWGMLQVLAVVFSTSFYYQGIERMGRMALINLGIRLLSIPLIFYVVSGPEDVIVAFAIQASCFLLASLVNLWLLLSTRQVCWVTPRWPAYAGNFMPVFPCFYHLLAQVFITIRMQSFWGSWHQRLLWGILSQVLRW